MQNRTKLIKKEIDQYLEMILAAASHMEDGLSEYLSGKEEAFLRHVEELSRIEHDLDEMRRQIIETLYKYMLLPESRGDILGILEHLDDVANFSKIFLKSLCAERPDFPLDFHEDLNRIASQTRRGIEVLADGTNGYFTNEGYVSAKASQVSYYEREVDELTFSLTEAIFRDKKMDLGRKTHLRHILERLDRISDTAEDVSERIVISALKREI
jgi:predicted phosphate transport protein (TIGR00153 family)